VNVRLRVQVLDPQQTAVLSSQLSESGAALVSCPPSYLGQAYVHENIQRKTLIHAYPNEILRENQQNKLQTQSNPA